MADEPRVPSITDREQLAEADRGHFDAIAESRGSVRGPFTVLLNSPELAGRVADLGAYLRYESDLPARARELAILATAAEWGCAYVWVAHEPHADAAGVPAAAIDAVAERAPTDALSAIDTAVVRYVRTVLRSDVVPESAVESARNRFGVRGVTDLTATVGYYALLSIVCNALGVRPDEPAPDHLQSGRGPA